MSTKNDIQQKLVAEGESRHFQLQTSVAKFGKLNMAIIGIFNVITGYLRTYEKIYYKFLHYTSYSVFKFITRTGLVVYENVQILAHFG